MGRVDSTPKLFDCKSSLLFRALLTCILESLSGRQCSVRFFREGTACNITGSGCEPFRFGSDRVTSFDLVGENGVRGVWNDKGNCGGG